MKKTGEETLTKINNLQLIQRNDFQNFTLDSVLLSDFITINRTIKNALDIGTGNGIISLLLANRSKANIVAIELYEIMAEVAKRNVISNKLEDRIDVIQADIRDYEKHFKKDNFDLIFCNPPYFEYDGNNAQVNELDQLAKARHEIDITIKEIIQISAYLLRNKGYFTLVFRSDRVFEVVEMLKAHNLAPKRIKYCYTGKDKDSKLCLIEAVKDASQGVKVEYPIFIYDDNGEKTEYIKKLYEIYE
ncbi:MAG: tRNA1(Val) (adenine(37)-N6)-methyltransferase [Leptotrichiaceae bacterium]